MGSEICRAVDAAPDLELVAQVSRGDALSALTDAGAQVVVDVTHPDAVLDNVRFALDHGVAAVVGTSGVDAARLETVRGWLAERPGHVLVAPNFGVGAVLAMQFARQAARFFESVEVIELHHAGKVDAPSGTAVRTAALLAQALGTPDSVRRRTPPPRSCPVRAARTSTGSGCTPAAAGLVAHQEVVLGTDGEMLTIRHDSMNRSSFMSGVLLAVRNVRGGRD
jgi:4-hydroxy-tetrahydrodipicolinate reductase